MTITYTDYSRATRLLKESVLYLKELGYDNVEIKVKLELLLMGYDKLTKPIPSEEIEKVEKIVPPKNNQ